MRHEVQTELGTLELWLPAGARLQEDPGVESGRQVWWSPDPEAGALTVSHGPAEGRAADDLLALEQRLGETMVESDEERDGAREVVATATASEPRHVELDRHGQRRSVPERMTRERLRFRFWHEHDLVVRAGYRLAEEAPAEMRAQFDRAVDEARLR